jgi:prephenate dehydratase
MTKILSYTNKYGEYLFYIDIIIDNNMDYEYMKSKIKYRSCTFFILGEYINFLL